MGSAIICKRDNTDTELVVMAPTKHHLILTMVMTRMKNHPTEDTNLIMAMTLTKNHLTDMILISHHTMNMKNLMRNHTNQSMKTSHPNLNTSKSHTMIMKNLITRIHMNKNMSPSHTMIMKLLITIPMSLMIITQSLSMSITKNIPIHLPNTSMATNNPSTRNMAAVIITTKSHMGVTK